MIRRSFPKVVLIVGLMLAVLVVAAFMAARNLNGRMLAEADPPKEFHSLEDFQWWLGDDMIAAKDFADQQSGKRFKVILAPPARILASGPSAYLFDETGSFVEWTPDAGDTRTNRSGFDLSGKALR